MKLFCFILPTILDREKSLSSALAHIFMSGRKVTNGAYTARNVYHWYSPVSLTIEGAFT